MTWIPLVGSAIGLICGGYISDVLSTRYGRRGRILFLIISGIAAFPFIFLALSGFSYKWSFSWLFIGTLFSESWLGVLIVLYLSLLPKKMHASGIALAFLIIWNIAGNMTLLVDPLKSLLGEEAALIILYPGLVALSSFILWGVYPLLE
jgi:MFS family permease